ncbi:MAG: pyridoxal-phosphate dependent enzyme [Desulfobacterales bacterium]
MTNSNFLDEDQPYRLLDGATGEALAVYREMAHLRKIAGDPAVSLETRLDAFEDILDSEIGDTSLIRGRNIEREIGIRQVYLKFEGGNPTGTQKDRIAFAQALDAMRRRFDFITVATCGNYGVALSLASSLAGLGCIIFIPQNYHSKRIKEMKDLGAEVIRTPGDYESAVTISKETALKKEYYDANPGGNNTSLQLRSYGQIAYEVYDELRDAPHAVAVPVSNGTTLAGIYRGFLSLYRRGKTSRMPRMVAGSSFNKNPIIQAYLKNTPTCEDLKPQSIRETQINEPLVNWHAIDGNPALEAIRQTNGWAGNASDKNMIHFSRLIRDKEGLQVLPSSTAGLIGLIDRHKREALPNDRYVVVLTGRRS